MSLVDFDLLTPISADTPCGENLEYDPRFLHLEEMTRSCLSNDFSAKSTAEKPDWEKVTLLASTLLQESKDLRILLCLCLAEIKRQGIHALFETLATVRLILSTYWDTTYPLIEIGAPTDATQRSNTLLRLVDAHDILGAARDAVIFPLHAMVKCTLRTLAFASKDPKAITSDQANLHADLQRLKHEISLLPPEDILHIYAQTQTALIDLEQITDLFTEHRTNTFPDFALLRNELSRLVLFIRPTQAKIPPTPAAPGSQTQNSIGDLPGSRYPDFVIHRREDVILILQAICDYYTQHQPSSPIPYLLQRAIRWTQYDFMQLLKDAAPSALEEFRTIAAPPSDKEPPA